MNKLYIYQIRWIWVLIFINLLNIRAQEGQFTQFYNTPLYINPAEAGSANFLNVNSHYRKQWPQITKSYTTQALSADMPIGKFGYGLLFSKNGAGQGSLIRTNFMAIIAKHINLDTNNILSLGFQFGMVQNNINNGDLKFDNQYSTVGGYDPSNPTGENFNTLNSTKIDGGFGLNFKNQKYSWKPKLGVSINHIFQSNYSLITDLTPLNARQLNATLGFNKSINSKTELIPYLFLAKQRNATNFQLGTRVGFSFTGSQKLYIGAGYRNSDALLTYVGLQLNKLMLGLSYDVNTSKLKPGSKSVGAWELSLGIKFAKKSKSKKIKEESKEDEISAIKDSLVIDTSLISTTNAKIMGNDSAIVKETKLPLSSNDSLSTSLLMTTAKTEPQVKDEIVYSSINPNQIKNRIFIYFDTDKSIVKTEYQTLIQNFVKELQSHKKFQVLVSGHTDSDGDALYNIYLGDARAQEVMKYMVELGVSLDCIKTFTYGKSSPMVDNNQINLKAKNRRVELLLVEK